MSITFTEAVDTLFTHTLTNRKPEIKDQVFDATPFWNQLNSMGGIQHWVGGRYLEIPVTKSTNPTGKWLDEDGTVSLEDFDPDTLVRYDWGYYGIGITRKWKNDQQNNGKAALKRMIESKIKTTKATMTDDFENALFAAQSGQSIYGLQDAIYYTGSGGLSNNTYPSGYNRATETWWANYYKDSSSPALVNLVNDLSHLTNTISQGRAQYMPTMYMTSQTGYELLEQSVEQKFKIVNRLKDGDVKFQNILFYGVPVYFSPACPQITSGEEIIYAINLRDFELVIDPKFDFTPTPWKESMNQPHTRAMQLTSALQLVVERSKSQGVLTGVKA